MIRGLKPGELSACKMIKSVKKVATGLKMICGINSHPKITNMLRMLVASMNLHITGRMDNHL